VSQCSSSQARESV